MSKYYNPKRTRNIFDPTSKDPYKLSRSKLEQFINCPRWRDALKAGISHFHKETNLVISGGIDDVWINPNGELIIVDYKSTSKDGEITELDQDWQDGYKRQVEQLIIDTKKCLMSDVLPESNPDCDYCRYRNALKGIEI